MNVRRDTIDAYSFAHKIEDNLMTHFHLIPTVHPFPFLIDSSGTHVHVESCFNSPILLTACSYMLAGKLSQALICHEDGRCLSLEVIFKAGVLLVLLCLILYYTKLSGGSPCAVRQGCNSGQLQQAGGIRPWEHLEVQQSPMPDHPPA